jgi:hydroxymethylpyrimidine pyrophosphatase-like HAD family hydrolase
MTADRGDASGGLRVRALASDYDGTLATGGAVASATLEALQWLRASGRRLLLVTGRALDDVRQVCQPLAIFDLVVAENGGLLYEPSTGAVELLGAPPPAAFVSLLAARGVPLSSGRVVVATTEEHLDQIAAAERELGLTLRVSLNKGAVMVLPAGVDKGSGLRRALSRLGLAAREVAGIGDAENDLEFLPLCGYRVAVANALPAVRRQVQLVTRAANGAGVRELIERILASDLREVVRPGPVRA